MTRHLHGFHDPGGEDLHGDKPGWTLVTEEVGLNPQAPGRDYTPISNRGIGVIVRLNHAYGRGGTVPIPDKYPEFAAACASWAARSRGVEFYIIANEPNHEAERPNGVVILPEDYARCFTLCRNAIKQAQPEVKVMHAAMAPYHASPTNWLTYLKTVLTILGPQGCDAIDIHAYARSMNPVDISSRATMGGVLGDQYSGFYTYRDVLTQGVPLAMTNLPAFITEFDVYGPWLDQNTGVIQAMYADTDEWNSQPGTQKILGALCFRWLGPPDVENVHDWEMRNKPRLLDDFRAAVGRGYRTPKNDAPGASSTSHTQYLPSAHGGTMPAQPESKIEWDERLTQRGIELTRYQPKPKEIYLEIVKGEYWEEKEHTFADVFNIDGTPAYGVNLRFWWGGGGEGEHEDKPTAPNAERWMVDFPMFNAGRSYGLKPANLPGDSVFGMGLGSVEQPDWNIHVSYKFEYRFAVGGAAEREEPVEKETPSLPPPPTIPGTPVPLSAHLILPCQGSVTQRWGQNPQNYARFGIPGHNGLDIASSAGTPIKAVADGRVAYVGTDVDYGHYVRITHPQLGFDSFYAHLLGQKVRAGNAVRQGQEIGAMGSTGNSTGNHLHLEFRLSNENNYIQLSGGYGKGRFDPEIAYHLLSRASMAQPTSNDLRSIVKAAAIEFGIEPALFDRLVQQESSYRPDVVSSAGAIGLAQVMPATFAEHGPRIGASKIHNPKDNVRTGAAYLRYLQDYFDGDMYKALIAYNWGMGRVLAGKAPPVETIEYANKVLGA